VAPNEDALEALAKKAEGRYIQVSRFREPDRNNELTAIALGPEGRRITSSLPLALSR
jgi:hypothetical protein